jgi:hypothetical protein
MFKKSLVAFALVLACTAGFAQNGDVNEQQQMPQQQMSQQATAKPAATKHAAAKPAPKAKQGQEEPDETPSMQGEPQEQH